MRKSTFISLIIILLLLNSCDLFKSSREASSNNMPLKKEKLENKESELSKEFQEDKNNSLNNSELEEKTLAKEKSALKKEEPLIIGIQENKTNGNFTYSKDSYDFNKNFIFKLEKQKLSGDSFKPLGTIIFTIIDKIKSLNEEGNPNPGEILVIKKEKINNFKNAMTNGGSFKATSIAHIATTANNTEIDIRVKKEQDENEYVFIDKKILNGLKSNGNSYNTKEVSFAFKISDFNKAFALVKD